ncbi:Pilus assembly protein, ATPase of CpaF family [Promicromonospora umidemergens]|uniref:CpaF/VirB11 family protein n=2 Tax=Promicromonospora TaxID=43676 RepID=A0ABP8XHA1_9MICO|nr:ATPase, T2SS/T4P/T4SS family [Promicromonospora umidemergens]MCP2284972.1 Pilus assembly protein, ATPase of CpaF family [Promicromonospora umidemergens]
MTALRDTRSADDSSPDYDLPRPTSIPFLTEPLPDTTTVAPTTPGLSAGTGANPWVAPSGTVHLGPDVNWSLVASLRTQASKDLAARASAAEGPLDRPAREQLAWDIIQGLIAQIRVSRANTDGGTLSTLQQSELAQAVFDALYRMGRLQPLLEDKRVENVLIYGFDEVWLELNDGALVAGPQVADSDEQLIEFLQFLASRSEANPRIFSEARPRLHLQLDDGSRLAAVAWVTPRPQVTIRRHRVVEVSLDDLARDGVMTPLAAQFLAAAVRDRRSIVVSGSPGAGKTTLVRALCSHIHPLEQIATIETEAELRLQERRRFVRAWEARPGTGEIGPDGRQAGEYTLSDAVWDSLRFNVQRTVVGEIRGPEVIAMLKTMENGSGSLSTTHARGAIDAIEKLTTCAMEAGAQFTHDMVTAKLAQAIDLVVHIELTLPDEDDEHAHRGGARPATVRRRVTEIVAISRGDQPGTFASTRVFTTGPDGQLVPGVLPDEYRSLARRRFDLAAYAAAQSIGGR